MSELFQNFSGMGVPPGKLTGIRNEQRAAFVLQWMERTWGFSTFQTYSYNYVMYSVTRKTLRTVILSCHHNMTLEK